MVKVYWPCDKCGSNDFHIRLVENSTKKEVICYFCKDFKGIVKDGSISMIEPEVGVINDY